MSTARRKQILDVIAELAPLITVYNATPQPCRGQREERLLASAGDLAKSDVEMFIIEKGESVEELDRKFWCKLMINDARKMFFRNHAPQRREQRPWSGWDSAGYAATTVCEVR